MSRTLHEYLSVDVEEVYSLRKAAELSQQAKALMFGIASTCDQPGMKGWMEGPASCGHSRSCCFFLAFPVRCTAFKWPLDMVGKMRGRQLSLKEINGVVTIAMLLKMKESQAV